MKTMASTRISARGIATGCLAGVLLLALALRLWGLDFGLPYIKHPDEPYWVNAALKIVKTGDLNPHTFIYPSLLLYVNSLAYLVYFAIGRAFGVFQSLADLVEPIVLIGGSGKVALPALFLIGRSVSLVLGLGTVALIFDLGRRYTGHLLGGVLAGLWVAISPTLVAHDRYHDSRWPDDVLHDADAVGIMENTGARPYQGLCARWHRTRSGDWDEVQCSGFRAADPPGALPAARLAGRQGVAALCGVGAERPCLPGNDALCHPGFLNLPE